MMTPIGTDGSESGDDGTTMAATSAPASGDASGGSSTATTEGPTTAGGESTTGSDAFDIAFAVRDPSILPLEARVEPGWRLVTSEAEWAEEIGGPGPRDIEWGQQWLLVGSRGPQPFPGHALDATALTWQQGVLVVEATATEPDNDCQTFQFTWPADTLLVFDALDEEVQSVEEVQVVEPASCAMGATESMDCNLEQPCATGLLCAGLIRSLVLTDRAGGLCLPAEYGGVFTGPAVRIPADGATAEIETLVRGLTTVDMDVVVWVELDHPAPEELVIELRNPDGNQVVVATMPSSPLHPGGIGIVPSGFSGDEAVVGNWSLIVRDDVVNANNGSVIAWELEIMSRFD